MWRKEEGGPHGTLCLFVSYNYSIEQCFLYRSSFPSSSSSLSPSFSSSPILISDSLELLPPHFIVLYDISLKVHILCAPYECPTLHCWAQSHQVTLHVCLSRTPLHTSVYLCFVTPSPTNPKRCEHDDGHYEQSYGHQHGNEPHRLWEGQIS